MENKEKLVEKIKSVRNPIKEINTVYEVLDELGIKYKKSKCSRCRKDLYNIALEELGFIDNAAEESEFNSNSETYSGPMGTENFTTNEPNDEGWVYIGKRTQTWNGHLINNNTPTHVIEEFVKRFPKGYYIKVQTNKNNNE